MNNEIKLIHIWVNANALALNDKKIKCIHYPSKFTKRKNKIKVVIYP